MEVKSKYLPESLIFSLAPEGFIANKTGQYIQNWGLYALRDDPEIVEAIYRGNHGGDASSSPYEGAFIEAACFLGMHLIGLAFCYRMYRTTEIYHAGEEVVSLIVQSRGADGYLGSFPLETRMGGDKLGTDENWDIWGQYMMSSGLFYWYKATGNQQAKTMAIEEVDHCMRHFEIAPML